MSVIAVSQIFCDTRIVLVVLNSKLKKNMLNYDYQTVKVLVYPMAKNYPL